MKTAGAHPVSLEGQEAIVLWVGSLELLAIHDRVYVQAESSSHKVEQDEGELYQEFQSGMCI
jgi:hypothetical protein